ncbi:hypothetical protein BN129_492 [Cronobacter sakazakii 701]|nr:hypothetical protein BN129_492 [Cronobacter sakazakii 701]
MLKVFGDLLAGLKRLAALFANLVEAVLRRKPGRRMAGERLNAALDLLQLLAQRHALFTCLRNAVGERRDAGFQLIVQRFEIFRVIVFALAFAELGQQALGILLFAQALFQLGKAHTQRLHLFSQMALLAGVAQQFARHVPGLCTAYRAINAGDKLISLFKLAVRGLRDAHFLLKRQQPFGSLLLFGLEDIQPFIGAVGAQIRQMAQLAGALQRGERLLVLNSASLLHVKRLLIVGKLAFEFVDFKLGGFRAGFVLFLLLRRFRHHFALLFQANLQLFEVSLVALDFLLLAQRGLHQIQVIARRLIIGFEIAFSPRVLGELARHIDMLILLGGKLLAAAEQLAAQLQRLIEMNTPLVGVAHVIRRHIVGGFGNQVFEEIAVRLGDADSFQRHAVFAQRRFHILERFTHAAVFRQQVITKRAGDSAGDPAVERSLNQTVIFAAIGR